MSAEEKQIIFDLVVILSRGRKHAITNKRIKEARSLLQRMKAKDIPVSFSYLGHNLKIHSVELQLELIDELERRGYITQNIPHYGRIILI